MTADGRSGELAQDRGLEELKEQNFCRVERLIETGGETRTAGSSILHKEQNSPIIAEPHQSSQGPQRPDRKQNRHAPWSISRIIHIPVQYSPEVHLFRDEQRSQSHDSMGSISVADASAGPTHLITLGFLSCQSWYSIMETRNPFVYDQTAA